MKKGQITVFIIAGVVMLFAAGILLLVYGQRAKMLDTETSTAAIQQSMSSPILNYVDECLQTIAIDGFNKIGEHGGYIDIDDPSISGNIFTINNDVTEGDVLLLDEQKIAYWWYMNSNNRCTDCTLDTLMPSLSEIERQMNKYIERELGNCLGRFKQFESAGYQINEGEIDADTVIGKDDVTIVVSLPLQITRGGHTFSVPNEFVLNLDLKFREIYELAVKVTVHEINEQFLEDLILHLIGLYSYRLDSSLIPPIAWADNEMSIVTWTAEDTKQKMIEYVLPTLLFLQVKNTRDAVHITDAATSLEQGMYDIMFLDIDSVDYPNLAVNFLYDSQWPIFFSISPSRGGILEPSVHRQEYFFGLVPPSQTNTYEFFYDLAVPILVSIRDNTSLRAAGKRGYTFMFALEPNLRDNKDLQDWSQGSGTYGAVEYSGSTYDYNDVDALNFDCDPSDPVYSCLANGTDYQDEVQCNNECYGLDCPIKYTKWTCPDDGIVFDSEIQCKLNCSTQSTSPRSDEPIETGYCDMAMRISGDIKIQIRDKKTNAPIEGVSISYECGNFDQCPIGSTNTSGTFMSKFPICIGEGYLVFEKEGYAKVIEDGVSIEPEIGQDFYIELDPFRQAELEVYYINVSNLFYMKQFLKPNSGTSIFDDLYKTRTECYPSPLNPILTICKVVEEGILHNILVAVNKSTSKNTSAPIAINLTRAEADVLMDRIRYAQSRINSVRNYLNNMEYRYQLDESKVVQATLTTDDAVTIGYDILHNESYRAQLIGTRFQGSYGINTDEDARLAEYQAKLHSDVTNIKYLQGPQMSDPDIINWYRENAHIISEKEEVKISFLRVKEEQYDPDFSRPNIKVNVTSVDDFDLIPGDYKIYATFIDNGGLVVEGTDHTPAMLGGVELKEQSQYFQISEADLDSGKKIRIYVLKVDDPKTAEDMAEIGKVGEYSTDYSSFLTPEFTN